LSKHQPQWERQAGCGNIYTAAEACINERRGATENEVGESEAKDVWDEECFTSTSQVRVAGVEGG